MKTESVFKIIWVFKWGGSEKWSPKTKEEQQFPLITEEFLKNMLKS